jgi:hypothetical protein
VEFDSAIEPIADLKLDFMGGGRVHIQPSELRTDSKIDLKVSSIDSQLLNGKLFAIVEQTHQIAS